MTLKKYLEEFEANFSGVSTVTMPTCSNTPGFTFIPLGGLYKGRIFEVVDVSKTGMWGNHCYDFTTGDLVGLDPFLEKDKAEYSKKFEVFKKLNPYPKTLRNFHYKNCKFWKFIAMCKKIKDLGGVPPEVPPFEAKDEDYDKLINMAKEELCDITKRTLVQRSTKS